MDKRYQIFVSSTYSDLRDERERVINELTRIGYIAAGMEQFPATDEEQMEYIQRVIDESDYYVVIVRGRYGSEGEDGVSFTEKEFNYALETKKPVLAFLFRDLNTLNLSETDSDPQKLAKLLAFRQKLEAKRIVRYWDNLHDLVSGVKDSVNDIVRRRPGIGWIRGDQALDPKVYKDLEEVRRENETLSRKVQELEGNELQFPEHLSHGEDKITLRYELLQKDPGKPWASPIFVDVGKFQISWNKLFISLVNSIYEERSEDEIRKDIQNLIQNSSVVHPDHFVTFSSNDAVEQIRYQFEALGLIKPTAKWTEGRSSYIAWSITDKGRKYISSIRAVRRKTEIASQ